MCKKTIYQNRRAKHKRSEEPAPGLGNWWIARGSLQTSLGDKELGRQPQWWHFYQLCLQGMERSSQWVREQTGLLPPTRDRQRNHFGKHSTAVIQGGPRHWLQQSQWLHLSLIDLEEGKHWILAPSSLLPHLRGGKKMKDFCEDSSI